MKKIIRKTANGTTRIVKNKVSKTINAEELAKNWDNMQDFAKSNLDPRNVKKGRVETFEAAMERQSLTEEDIASSYKYYNFRFMIFSAFATLSLIFLLHGILKSQTSSCLIAVAGLLIFTSNMFNSSFRCFQIRHRALFPVKAWIQNPSEWIPENYPTASSKSNRKK